MAAMASSNSTKPVISRRTVVRMVLTHPFEQLDAGGMRHFLITKDNVDRLASKQLFGVVSGASREDAEVGR